jgi:hypothetical protein
VRGGIKEGVVDVLRLSMGGVKREGVRKADIDADSTIS